MKKFVTTVKKKAIVVSIATITGISVSSLALASSSEPAVVSSSTSSAISNAGAAVSNALKEIGTTIQASAMALAHKTDTMVYQLDANLGISQQAIAADQSATQTARKTAQDTTQSDVKDSLWAFPETIVTPDTSTEDGSAMKTDMSTRSDLYDTLTLDTPASDTLYIDDSSLEGSSDYASVAKPSTTYNNYFNFDSLFTPDAYNNDANATAAQKYIQYAGSLYEPLTDDVDYSTLKSKLSDYSSASDKASYLKTIVENPTYQEYQLSVRSLVAARSAAISNFNYMMTERKPVENLGTDAGMPDDPNLPSGTASPLQVQNYVATHRVHDADWYKQMQHASPTTLQREQVTILAEIEAQLQRNYMLYERTLSTLSVMSLQANTLQKMSLKAEASDVNNLINPQDTDDSTTDTTTTDTTTDTTTN